MPSQEIFKIYMLNTAMEYVQEALNAELYSQS